MQVVTEMNGESGESRYWTCFLTLRRRSRSVGEEGGGGLLCMAAFDIFDTFDQIDGGQWRGYQIEGK